MSYLHSKPSSLGDAFPNSIDSAAQIGHAIPFIQSSDSAVDLALRSVPLPDGMLNRLKRMALTMPDDSTGHVDYLGC